MGKAVRGLRPWAALIAGRPQRKFSLGREGEKVMGGHPRGKGRGDWGFGRALSLSCAPRR